MKFLGRFGNQHFLFDPVRPGLQSERPGKDARHCSSKTLFPSSYFHPYLSEPTLAMAVGLLQLALKPFTVKGFYLLVWGTALGSNVWNTVVSCTFPVFGMSVR